VPPELDRYEERYRLTIGAVLGLASIFALPQGNEQAPGCPVPDVASGATRTIIGWRLDREHLSAVAAAAAPGIPVIAFTTGPNAVIEGAG